MSDVKRTYSWLDLSPYKLMAQLAVDAKGNQALMIRPDSAHVDAQKSAEVAKTLDLQFQKIRQQVGESKLVNRVLRGNINILTGQMIRTPVNMHAFLLKVFPLGIPLELTFEQLRQHEAIRNAANALRKANAVTPEGPLHLESLNAAMPAGAIVRVTGQTVTISLDDKLQTARVPNDPTNDDLVTVITGWLNTQLVAQKTDDRDTLIKRLADLNARIGQPDQGFWVTTLARSEKAVIESWVADIDNKATHNTDQDNQNSLENPAETITEEKADAGVSGSEGGKKVWDNVQQKEVGKNLDGEMVYEDNVGVRFRFEGDFKVKEKVKLVPTRAGVQTLRAAPTAMEFMTVAEALAAPATSVSLEAKIRAAALHQVAPEDRSSWQALSVPHEGVELPMIARSLSPEDRLGQLQVMRLSHKALREGAEPTLNAQLFRLTPANTLESLGLPSEASAATVKIWTACGLSLPGSPSVAGSERLDGATVEADEDSKEQTDDNTNATDGAAADSADALGDRAGDSEAVPTDQGTAAGPGGSSGTVPAGGRSGGLHGQPDGAERGVGDPVPDSVADRDESGVTEPGEHGRSVLGGDPESGNGATGDQLGTPLDAGLAVRGTGGSGGGVDAGSGQSGNPEPPADEQDRAGLGAADGRDRAVFGETGAGGEGRATEGEPSDRGGDSDHRGGKAEVSDEGAGEPRSADGTAGRPIPGDSGADRGTDGSTVSDRESPSSTQAGPTAESDGTGGATPDVDATGSDGDGATGDSDWQRFADEQSAGGTGATAPLYLEPGFELRSPAQRLSNNIAALNRLFELERDGGAVTLEDRETLAAFTGFGGIHANMFRVYGAPNFVIDGTRSIQKMLSSGLMTEKEYNTLTSSTLNAHYTHSGIIAPLWEALVRTDAPLGRVLEPSCGMLNFKAFMPESAREKVGRFTGVEIDPLTARMAALAHPDATVLASGFEKTTFPDNFFDAAVSNVPFGNFDLYDREHPERKASIHNAFFLKSLDKVRPGGVIAFVTSAYVMDARDTRVREEIMDRSHVMGAYRLPSGTFEKSTGTEVVTDVIFLQKKGDFTPNYEPLNILKTRTIEAPLGASSSVEVMGKYYEPGEMVPFQDINELYAEQPDRVLGELTVMTGQHGPKLSVRGGGTLEEQRDTLSRALASIPKAIAQPEYKAVTADDIARAHQTRVEKSKDMASLPGALSLIDGEVHQVSLTDDGELVQSPVTDIPKAGVKRTQAAIAVMLSLSNLLEAETAGKESDAQLDARREEARGLIDQWEALEQNTKAAFPRKSWKLLGQDPRARQIQFDSLYDEESRSLKRPDIVNGRTVRPMTDQPTSATDIETALAISLAYTATISETYMADLLVDAIPDITVATIRQQLIEKNLAFVEPNSDSLVESGVYLSGNLRPKIDSVKSIVDSAPEFQRNLDALEAALPAPLTPSQVKVGLDAFWLPKDVVEQFLREGLGLNTSGKYGVIPVFDDHNRVWRLEPAATNGKPSMASIASNQSHVAHSRFGTERCDAFKLLTYGFTNTIPKVMDKIQDEPPKYVINAEETLKAQAKFDEITDLFNRWIFKDGSRAQRLCDIYNENFNTTVLYDPDGSHLSFPGMAESWEPRKHQADFIWRAVSGKNAMTAHVVGAGKTLQLIGTAIRGKQMGRWNKPLVVVPNHMLEQFSNDGQSIYPNAKILMMSASDARAVNRPAFAAKCAMGDWDLVVCTHSVFEKISVPQEFEVLIVDRELNKLRAALGNAESNAKPKDVEKAIKKLETRLERTLDNMRKGSENILNMGEIGIDFMGIDEAHYYKNLMVDTSSQIPGISNASSSRAMNMQIKCQYLRELHGDCYGVMMATGTPISNSVTECYTFTRMLRPDLLEEAGIMNFNDWMGLYGEVKHGMEIKPEGGGYQMKSRLSSFKNVPELIKMVRTFIDVKTNEDLNLPLPEIEDIKIAAPQSEFMQGFMKYIEARARTTRNRKKDDETLSPAELIAADIRESLYKANDSTTIDSETGEVDEDLIDTPADDILLTIATDGRKASLDPRLLHPEFEDFEQSKVNECVKTLMDVYYEFDEQKAAQMVFCDFSSPTGKGIFNVYDDIKAKLIKAGVPENEIAFIHDCKTDADKETLFDNVRSGNVRFLLGSTLKMGVGTNVQERLAAIHELDPPWTPSSVSQRRGRIERQGNSIACARSYRYVTVDSFDVFMWETIIRKDQMIRKAMQNPENCAREMSEAVDPTFADIQAVATGNPLIREFMDLKQQMEKFKRLRDGHTDQQADLGNRIVKQQEKIAHIEEFLASKVKEQNLVVENTPLALHIEKAIPGLCEGPMAVTGGLKNLANALSLLADQCPRFTTTTIGTFGGLTVKFGNMGNGHTLILERLNGNVDNLRTINNQMDSIGMAQDRAMGDDADDATPDPEDDFYKAAKDLVRLVRKIGQDNGITGTQEAIESAQSNLKRLEEDLGMPFAYEDQMAAAKARYEELVPQVGESISANVDLDPKPLLAFAREIHKATGQHADLVARAQAYIRDGGTPTRIVHDPMGGMNDEQDDQDLEQHLA